MLDKPIETAEQDELSREKFIEQIASSLVYQESKKSTGAVIGLCGEWGSGKSSVLNLLDRHLRMSYGDSLILRFDPWLISTREALIDHFMSDLRLMIQSSGNLEESSKSKISELISEYDGLINVGIDTVALVTQIPIVGNLFKAGKDLIKTKKKTLHQIKLDLSNALSEIDIPIVVLIDEVDRLEDQEILEIMRLVKAVADFPNISYLVAYDVDRVIEALGSGKDGDQSKERGHSYLEKIIQYQVQIPALFEDELIDMLRRELLKIVPDIKLPEHRFGDARFTNLENSVFPLLLRTPRDLKRAVGTFRTLFQMVSAEVNWIDLLGYSVLLTKAPTVAEAIRSDPVFFTDEFGSGSYSYARYGFDAPKSTTQLASKLDEDWTDLSYAKLIKFLFPRFEESDRANQIYGTEDHSELRHYRALCFLVRQGTPPGALPITSVIRMFKLTEDNLLSALNGSVEEERFNDLNYILSYFYEKFEGLDHCKFWTTVAKWCAKPNSAIPKERDPRIGYLEIVERSFQSALTNGQLADISHLIVNGAIKEGAYEFASRALRDQIWGHGLFGKKIRHNYNAIGNKNDWKLLCEKIAGKWKHQHLSSEWFFESWKESPVWILTDVGIWDEECRNRVAILTKSQEAFDALILMAFGGHYIIDRSGIDTLVGWDVFVERLKRYSLNRESRTVSEDVENAFNKIVEHFGSAVIE